MDSDISREADTMKKEDFRSHDESLELESAFKRARTADSARKRRRRRDDLPNRLYRYLRELDR